jgi:hypothetical protein
VSHSRRWLYALLCFAFVTSVGPSADADSASDQAAKLAGSHAREWVFKRWETMMGPGNRCKAGESYRFKADGSVAISSCVGGQTRTQTQPWAIESADALETHVKIGATSYILKFWENATGHFMMLRIMGQTQVDPTKDKIFQLAED